SAFSAVNIVAAASCSTVRKRGPGFAFTSLETALHPLPARARLAIVAAIRASGRIAMKPVRAFATLAFAFVSFSAFAADYPAPKQAEWIARDFKFHTGEVLPELRISYTTVGEPTGQPVLVLHGTTGSAASMLTPG